MKKRLLLFLIFIPFSYALDCIVYEDCAARDCVGAARFCHEGNCVLTECVNFGTHQLYYKTDAFGGTAVSVDAIVSMGGKFILLAIVALVIALMFPMLKLHKKVKILVVIGFAIAVILFGLYLFVGEDLFYDIIGKDGRWDSHRADTEIIKVVNKEGLSVQEKILAGYSEDIKGGKEYILNDRLHESSVIILELRLDKQLDEMGISIMGSSMSVETIEGKDVNVYQNPLYNTYAWKNDNLVFLLSGEKKHTKELVRTFLSELNDSMNISQTVEEDSYRAEDVTDDDMYNAPPIIRITYPLEPYVDDGMVSFEVSDNDSQVDSDSIQVIGPAGFTDATVDCLVLEGIFNCTFVADVRPGRNTLIIKAADVSGKISRSETSFVFDNIPWKSNLIYPLNNGYVNMPNLKFEIFDTESGLNISSFIFEGINQSIDFCTELDKKVECSFENLEINEGSRKITIKGHDLAGNYAQALLAFVYDKTRPVIKLTNKGFTVQDNVKLRNESLYLDRKRYSLDNCHLIDKVYHCRYDKWISLITVMDEAGNVATVENKLVR